MDLPPTARRPHRSFQHVPVHEHVRPAQARHALGRGRKARRSRADTCAVSRTAAPAWWVPEPRRLHKQAHRGVAGTGCGLPPPPGCTSRPPVRCLRPPSARRREWRKAATPRLGDRAGRASPSRRAPVPRTDDGCRRMCPRGPTADCRTVRDRSSTDVRPRPAAAAPATPGGRRAQRE